LALERLKRFVAHAAPLTRMLFGVRVPHPTEQGHWDFSTLVLFDELRRLVRPDQAVLELGTGEVGVLSIALSRRIPARYLAIDVADEAVQSARRVAAANDVTVEFLQSDLLAAIPLGRTFDVTFFNPPYVPRNQSAVWKPFGEPSRVWDGGEDGLDVIRRFFAEAEVRGSRLGTLLIGFNRNSVSEAAIAGIAAGNGFVTTSVRRAIHPGTVLVFENRPAV
jgi:methylase of polypeptide subunit release factors